MYDILKWNFIILKSLEFSLVKIFYGGQNVFGFGAIYTLILCGNIYNAGSQSRKKNKIKIKTKTIRIRTNNYFDNKKYRSSGICISLDWTVEINSFNSKTY